MPQEKVDPALEVIGHSDNVARLRNFLEQTFTDIPALLEAWERGVANLSLFADDVAYEDANLPDHIGEVYRGHDGLLRAAKVGSSRSRHSLSSLRRSSERATGSSRFTAPTRGQRMWISSSREPLSYVWTFREGQVVHFRSIRDRTEALEAAGLSEDDIKTPR